jgi:hypothetical protein
MLAISVAALRLASYCTDSQELRTMSTNIITTIEATIRDAFPFSVEKYPLNGPDYMRTPHYGLFRSDNGECVGNACRQGYAPHTVDDVVALATAGAAAFGDDAAIRCNWREGHYLSIAPSDGYRRSIFGTQDNVFPRLIISAGYDGKSFRASLGYYRDACRNLAMLHSAGIGVSESIKHTDSLRSRVKGLRLQFERIARRWDSTVQCLQTMESRIVSAADFVNAVYPQSENRSTRTRNTARRRTEAIFNRLVRDRMQTGRADIGSDFMVSAWEAFNAIQGYVQHDTNRRGNPNAFDRAIMAFNDPAVMRAEQLALAS